jgi:multiple sugar transport system substrate-binding protein
LKKIMFVLLLAFLAFGLAACSSTSEKSTGNNSGSSNGGGNGSDQEVVTLKLGFYGEGDYLNRMETEWIPEFEQLHPNIKVETAADPDKIGFYQRLKTQFAADSSPDIARIIIEEFPSLAEKGALLSIQNYIERDNSELDMGDFAPSLLDAFKYKNELYGIPTDWNSSIIHYNKDLFDKAGVPYPNENWTWEDFRDAAKKLTVDKNGDGKMDQYGFAITDRLFWMVPWIYGAGGSLLNEDMTASALDTPEAKEGLKFYTNLVTKDKSALHLGGANPANIYDVFVNGQVAMASFCRCGLTNLEGKVNFDVAQMPNGPKQLGSVFGVGSYAIMKKTEHPEEAWVFLKWLTDKEMQLKITDTGSHVPTRKSVTETDEFNNTPEHGEIYWKDSEDAKLIESPAQFSEIEAVVNAELGLILEGSKSVDEGIEYMHERINQILGQ